MIKRIEPGSRASRAVEYGGHFVTGGVVADDKSADIVGQTKQVLAVVDELLKDAGLTRNDLTRVQIWLSDIGHFDGMNRVYDKWVAGYEKPARATVESRLADPGYLIEVQAFAYRA
ncbi:RidA family protein [Trinickia dinghuensis]|uniref:RidA family protein n=1 Tax=Trinickia dinghuensis TaxID=2291023 RepID=A0A3D8JT19_9BURK|nr:RidA family protein [Trinickia dinghuensis]RDU95912.1 RidA family protein [Trinickia dinghuensis]